MRLREKNLKKHQKRKKLHLKDLEKIVKGMIFARFLC